MELAAGILVAIRWVHLLAAVVFVGSAFFGLALLATPRPEVTKAVELAFREVLQVALMVLLLSGAILTFDRLAGGQASLAYVALLGLKIGLALLMFHVAYRSRRAESAGLVPSLRVLAAIGSIVLLLSVVVRTIYQAGGVA